MKFILKILGIILIAIVAGLGACMAIVSITPSVPTRYTAQVDAGGEVEARYLAMGEHDVRHLEAEADEPSVKFHVYYPEGLEGSSGALPTVVILNGTGILAPKYPALFKHLASWGFIVIGNEDPSTGAAASADQMVDYLLAQNKDLESPLYQHVDFARVGIEGHSQGGAGVFSALSISEHRDIYATGIALSPTHEEMAHAFGWSYKLASIEVPTLMLAGTEGEFETESVIPIDAMLTMYDELASPKAMARRIGADHGQMLYSADGYVTAWFMWQLQDDEEAARAFSGESAELLSNPLYQDQRTNL